MVLIGALSLASCFCAALANYDVVIAGGTQEAVTSAEIARRAGKSVCLVAPRNYLGEDAAGNYACVERGETPLEAKQALDLATAVYRLTGDAALLTPWQKDTREVFRH